MKLVKEEKNELVHIPKIKKYLEKKHMYCPQHILD